MSRIIPLKDILNQFMDTLDYSDYEKEQKIENSWEKIAGIKISSHSKIKEIKNGVLVIEVEHPGWIQCILFEKKNIIGRINKRFPELNIKDLNIFVGK